MKIAQLKPNTLGLRKLNLFKPALLAAGAKHGGAVKPYIAGHVTDGASTFTFKVNNQDVTVPVGADGNWKWVQDRNITSLKEAFKSKTNLDEILLKNIKTTGTCQEMLASCSALKLITIDNSISDTSSLYGFLTGTSDGKTVILKGVKFDKTTSCWRTFLRCKEVVGIENCTFENVTITYQMFYYYAGKSLNMFNANFPQFTSSEHMFTYATNLEDVAFKAFHSSISFAHSSKLTEQSVVNIFNAVAADGLTLTFHATVGAKIDAALEAGGEGTPEQNAIYNAYWDAYDRGYEINYTY